MRIEASIARARISGRPALILALSDPDGRVGWGEASPLPGYSPDDLEIAERALQAGSAELRIDETDARAAVAGVAGRAALAGSPSARFALETALLDLLGQRSGRSIAECLGGERTYPSIGRNALLHASSPIDELLEAARGLVGRGIEAVKVKIGRSTAGFAAELRVLEALRAALPAAFELRLDANGAFGVDEARARLAELAPLDVRFVEQPTTPERLVDLGPCRVPWAADESLRMPGMAERLLASDACSVFVLKPQVLGLLRAFEIGCQAQARGRDVVVTHTFDGPVAVAAACELALSLPRAPLACGLDPHDAATARIPQLAALGRVTASGTPGLGVAWSCQ